MTLQENVATTYRSSSSRDSDRATLTSRLVPGVTASFECIDVASAKRMLIHNKTNRPVLDSRVQRYADAMRRGEWNAWRCGQMVTLYKWLDDESMPEIQ